MVSFNGVRLDEQHSPVARAVVFKTKAGLVRRQISVKEVVVARKYDDSKDKWVTIAKGEAGVDDAKMIQSAIDVGGKVVLIGNFTLKDSILIGDDTVLDMIDAELKLADGVSKPVIKNKNESNTNITIIGGIIDGNGTNQSAGDGIQFIKVSDSKIIGVTILNVYGYGIILFNGCNNNIIAECRVSSSGSDNIRISDDCLHNIIAYNLSEKARGTGSGILIQVRSHENIVIGNICKENAYHGIALYAAEVFDYRCLRNVIKANQCIANTHHGIFADGWTSESVIEGNVCNGNGYSGIANSGGRNNVINNNYCSGNTNGISLNHKFGDRGFGIKVIGNSIVSNTGDGINVQYQDEAIIKGNTVRDNDGNGIVLYISSDCIVVGNAVYGNTNNGIRVFDDGATASLRNILEANRCLNNGGYGIITQGLTDYSMILGNTLIGNTTGSLSYVDDVTTPHAVIDHNML